MSKSKKIKLPITVQELRAPFLDFPKKKKYSIIYVDPPWEYRDKAKSGKRGAEFKYSCMELRDILILPVPAICKENCVLFLWATAPMLTKAEMVIRWWGFRYKTVAFTWIKTTKNGKLTWGMGSWTRANPEFLLLGVKGKPKRKSASVHSVIKSVRGKHSEKPAEARERIEKLMGKLPRIELFAREKVKGWDCWGDEV